MSECSTTASPAATLQPADVALERSSAGGACTRQRVTHQLAHPTPMIQHSTPRQNPYRKSHPILRLTYTKHVVHRTLSLCVNWKRQLANKRKQTTKQMKHMQTSRRAMWTHDVHICAPAKHHRPARTLASGILFALNLKPAISLTFCG